MSETVPVYPTTRQEYDYRSKERVKAQKLARGVLYILMLEVEGSQTKAGRLTVEVARLPVFGANISEEAAPMEVLFMNDDAQPVFQLTGLMKLDQLYLQPSHLRLVDDGSILREGYFLADESAVDMTMQRHELVDVGNHTSGFSL
ncbi:MAG: hypothetical protein JWN12_170 [Candidatus Saccharibacteria bacterium]|nr:hypothetical protein [Candidatus Saccharibacteria bacterium]